MPYIERSNDNKIIRVYSVPQYEGQEYVPEDDAELVEALNQRKLRDEALTTLTTLDLKSIRSMREWIAQQPNAPSWLLSYEEQAKKERTKLS